MNTAPRTRQRPGRTGREVEQQIGLARQLYGTGYHGTTPPPVVRASRDPLTIAQDLYAAAEHLADLDFAAGAFDDRTLSSADVLLVGCGRLIIALRQRQAVQS